MQTKQSDKSSNREIKALRSQLNKEKGVQLFPLTNWRVGNG